jgi:general secretion pathway protein G
LKQGIINMQSKKQQSTQGFTLIELLVVLVILGLLAGMVGPNVMKYVGSSKIEVAKAQLGDISAGLDLFKLDVGRYPSSKEGLQVLITAPEDVMGWNGPYLRKKKLPLDPWSRDYIYIFPGEESEYALLTLGADGEPEGSGENKDLSSWE